jgi:hypothetical protein
MSGCLLQGPYSDCREQAGCQATAEPDGHCNNPRAQMCRHQVAVSDGQWPGSQYDQRACRVPTEWRAVLTKLARRLVATKSTSSGYRPLICVAHASCCSDPSAIRFRQSCSSRRVASAPSRPSNHPPGYNVLVLDDTSGQPFDLNGIAGGPGPRARRGIPGAPAIARPWSARHGFIWVKSNSGHLC